MSEQAKNTKKGKKKSPPPSSSEPPKKKAKKSPLEKTEQQVVEEHRLKQEAKIRKETAKNLYHDEWLVAKSIPVAKAMVVGGEKLFICPVTGDATRTVYGIPFKKGPDAAKNDQWKFKGGFTSPAVALKWFENFLKSDELILKHYSADNDAPNSYFSEMVHRINTLVPGRPVMLCKGPIGVQTTNRRMYVDVEWEKAAEKSNYGGICRVSDMPTKPVKETIKITSYRSALVTLDEQTYDFDVSDLPSKSTILISPKTGILHKNQAMEVAENFLNEHPELVKSYADESHVEKMKKHDFLILTYPAAFKKIAPSVEKSFDDSDDDEGDESSQEEERESDKNKEG